MQEVQVVADPPAWLLSAWDRLVESTPGTDVTQLSVWARIGALKAFRPMYVFAWQRDRSLAGGAQVLVRWIPGLGGVGYVPYGPVVAQGADERALVVWDLAQGLAVLPGIRMLFVQPPEGGEDIRQALLSERFRPSSADIAPTGSVRLDLWRSTEEITRGMKPRLRSWTRRWAAEGVEIRMGDERDVPLLADLMRAAADARGYRRPPHADYLERAYIELARSERGFLWIGEVNGTPVTADMVTTCGEMVRGRWSGFDRHGPGGRLSVPAAARWAIIRWARAEGYRWLDFGGLSEQTLHDAVDCGIRSSATWPGPDQAKMSFGGTPYRYPAPVELIRSMPVRFAYDAVNRSSRGRAVLDHVKGRLRCRLQRHPSPARLPMAPPTMRLGS
ncbi:GNAT family N-acetyltransferase [Geodermatophilus sp. YIM 151500]|uniref:lipid II:glycine glycyltransferase FemX n=1 Tax=Geodermatophilus sp. YIM 151500 TaxID=2984531 RepID=UPI0021E4A8BE|nr:GNAT family N-acetyltransferase [Geodermatophilus sp. YIM 151500]MCV2490658.1 GNAT family N-acetyltransferase [Geodermatophilus sp. YIM 151500]